MLHKNLIQNIIALLLRPDYILLVEFNNEVYYIVQEAYFINGFSYKSSYVFDLRNMSEIFINIHQIQDILSGNPIKGKSTIRGKDKGLYITAEDFNKLRLLVNERIK